MHLAAIIFFGRTEIVGFFLRLTQSVHCENHRTLINNCGDVRGLLVTEEELKD